MIEPLIENVDKFKVGPDLAQAAISAGKSDMVKLFKEKGIDVSNPPERSQYDVEYRRSPYVIQAAASGDRETLQVILGEQGADIKEKGFIGFSKSKKN